MAAVFSDSDCAYIVTHMNQLTAPQLAAHLGRTPQQVRTVLTRFRRDGGWLCRLGVYACLHCDGPIVTRLGGKARVHPACWPTYFPMYLRAYRKQHRAAAAAYVTGWRVGHPVERAQQQERERVRQRELRQATLAGMTPAQRAAHFAVLEAWAQRDQALTQPHADQARRPWTTDDDQYVLDTMRDLVRDVALALGRSYFAVQVRRTVLKARRREELDDEELPPGDDDAAPGR